VRSADSARCFDSMAGKLRQLLRLAAERTDVPSAVNLDSCSVQSTPERCGRADYDGHKKRKDAKVHRAVDSLGHLLALKVTAANEPDRAQVEDLTQAVPHATGKCVRLANVDQGYTGEVPGVAAGQHGVKLEILKVCPSQLEMCVAAPALGAGTLSCVGDG